MRQRRDIWAVVPIKGFAGAKQRLGTIFSPGFRRQLAEIMVGDVLAALSQSASLGGILAVTDDPAAAALARRYGAEVSSEDAAGGHTAAVIGGGRKLHADGRAGMLAVPGDIPGVTAGEIDLLLARHSAAPGFTIVPAHDRRGSNAIVATPVDVVPLAYGNDSFLPHLQAARQCGIEPLIIEFAGIGLDVDAPDDLFALAAKNWPTRTDAFLKSSPDFAAARTEPSR